MKLPINDFTETLTALDETFDFWQFRDRVRELSRSSQKKAKFLTQRLPKHFWATEDFYQGLRTLVFVGGKLINALTLLTRPYPVYTEDLKEIRGFFQLSHLDWDKATLAAKELIYQTSKTRTDLKPGTSQHESWEEKLADFSITAQSFLFLRNYFTAAAAFFPKEVETICFWVEEEEHNKMVYTIPQEILDDADEEEDDDASPLVDAFMDLFDAEYGRAV